MANDQDAQAAKSQDRTIDGDVNRLGQDAQAAAAQFEGPPEGLVVAGTQWETQGCTDISEIGGEAFIELPDGTYHSLGVGVVKVSSEELQRQLRSKGKPAVSDNKIAQLREDGFVE